MFQVPRDASTRRSTILGIARRAPQIPLHIARRSLRANKSARESCAVHPPALANRPWPPLSCYPIQGSSPRCRTALKSIAAIRGLRSCSIPFCSVLRSVANLRAFQHRRELMRTTRADHYVHGARATLSAIACLSSCRSSPSFAQRITTSCALTVMRWAFGVACQISRQRFVGRLIARGVSERPFPAFAQVWFFLIAATSRRR